MRRLSVFWGLVLVAVPALLWAAHPLVFMNQADFSRSVGFMLEDTIPATQWVWRFKPAFGATGVNLSSWFFGIFGLLQLPFRDSYAMAVPALVAQATLVLGLAYFARKAAPPGAWPSALLLWAGLVVAAFQAHNIGIMNSFYPEVLFFVGLPVLLSGMVAAPGRWSAALLLVGATLVGMAKLQYFFVPALAWLVLVGSRRLTGGVATPLAAVALGCAQLLALLPMGDNAYRHLNYYHATFMGSYMVLTAAERQALGLTAREEACIGGDVWGNRGTGPGGTVIVTNSPTCPDRAIATRQVLEPYICSPSVLWRLAVFALPSHFTTDYFHVHASLKYLRVVGEPNSGSVLLQRLSAWRERFVTPLAAALLALALILGVVALRKGQRLGAVLVFLPVLAVSQVGISLVGEGIRDLSKHMWAAQLAIDLLLPLMVWQLVQGWRLRRQGGQLSPAPRP